MSTFGGCFIERLRVQADKVQRAIDHIEAKIESSGAPERGAWEHGLDAKLTKAYMSKHDVVQFESF